jgi:lysophospholipase L1-like esterase
MGDGTKIIHYTDTVGTSYVTYTLQKEQESFAIRNKGLKPIQYTVGSQTNVTVNPGESSTVNETFTSFQVRSTEGIQQFEVLLDEKGDEYPSPFKKITDEIGILSQGLYKKFQDINRVRLYQKLQELNSQTGKKVCCVGDSVTEGNVNGGHPWYEPFISMFPNITFINKGVGGNGTVDVINRLSDITSTNADMYILAVGTNDVRYQDPAKGATSSAGFKSNIATIVNALKANGAFVVVIEPWPSFNKDYVSVKGYSDRDLTMKLYSAAAKEYCGSNDIPYIEVIDYIKSALDFNNKSNFLVDYIHPNSTLGIKLYADTVLFGKRTSEDYGIPKSIAGSSVKYVYKLEILSAFGGNPYIDLKSLTINRSTVGTIWTTCMKNGNDDITKIFNTSNTTYHFRNHDNDFPVIITFGTTEPIYYLKQDFFTYGIGKYKLYESTDRAAILYFEHPSWRLVASEDYAISDPVLSFPRRFLYNAERTFSLSFQSGWSIKGSSSRFITKGNTVSINAQFIKSSAWSTQEVIATLPSDLVPNVPNQFPCIIFSDSGTDHEIAYCTIESTGEIKTPGRYVNSKNYDCIGINVSFSLT